MSPHFRAIERGGMKWDAGMILCEFEAMREPEATQFPRVGHYLASLGLEFNEVKPQMLWCGHIHPDLYIANQLDAVPSGWGKAICHPAQTSQRKASWPDSFSLGDASYLNHGSEFHETFIAPMCVKILGIPPSEVVAKYHRAAWLPIYHTQTLREKKSLSTKFWYPRCGYAGVIYESLAAIYDGRNEPSRNSKRQDFDSTEIKIHFVLAKPAREFQVLFVVDKSPIYRVTDMDACAGLNPEYHRFVIETREYVADITDEAQRLNLVQAVQYSSHKSVFLPLPTLANVRRGWKPAKHMNAQILELMDAPATQS